MVRPVYLPHVEKMLATGGIYVLHDPKHPDRMVPIFSSHGQLFAINAEQELDPGGFSSGVIMEGPIKCFSDRTEEEKRDAIDPE